MLRLGRKADHSAAFFLLKRHRGYHLGPLHGIQRPYSTSNPSEESSVTATPSTNEETPERIAKLASIQARRHEILHLQAEQRATNLQQRATLSKEEPENQGKSSETQEKSIDTADNALKNPEADPNAPTAESELSPKPGRNEEYRRKRARQQRARRKRAREALRKAHARISEPDPTASELDRSVVDEESQNAGGVRLQRTGVTGLTGMFTSLRERLESMSRSQPNSEDGTTPFVTDSSLLGLNFGSHHEAAPSVDVKDFLDAKETAKPKKTSKKETAKGEVKKTKKPSDKKAKDPSLAASLKSSPAKPKRRAQFDPASVCTIRPRKLKLCPVEDDEPPKVPKLAHKLDRVLFNSGVYDLQDKRSQVYNFDPYLSEIMPVDEFDFNALKDYVTSSKDSKLRSLSAKHGAKYCGSTSSMTAMLSQFHFLLSAWRMPEFEHVSRSFYPEFQNFTMITRAPAAAFARLEDGVYAIDADKEFDTANILSMLGKSMEKLLTLPKEEFEKYRKKHSHQLTEEEKNADEGFHYTTFGDFMMRSQLDAHDPRLPGTGMFDLKTRAVVTIRMDVQDYEKGVGYEISRRFGQWESYEREYYDMIRSAFLKYSLQVRMGRMDGIFVAFHNTQRIFGFQYISLQEMDQALHGSSHLKTGDEEFRASLALFNDLLNRASERFPGRSLRLHVETRPTNPPLMYFFAEPVSVEEMEKTQATGAASVKKFEREVLGRMAAEEASGIEESAEEASSTEELDQIEEVTDDQDPQGSTPWDELMAKVDETVENDSSGIDTVRDAIEQALEQAGLLKGKSSEEVESCLNLLVEALSSEISEGKDQASQETAAEEDVVEEEEEGESLDESVEEAGLGDKTLKEDLVEEDVDVSESAQESSQGKTGSFEQSMSESSTESSEQASSESSTTDSTGAQTSLSAETSSEDVTNTQNMITSKNNAEEVEVQDSASIKESIVAQEASATEEDNAAKENNAAEESNVVEEDNAMEKEISNEEDSKTAGQSLSLKDLILKVAEGVDTKTGSLGAFEGVLSKLTEQSKLAEQSKGSAQLKASTEDKINPEAQEAEEVEGIPAEDLETTPEREIFAAYVTVRNLVDGHPVERVYHRTGAPFKWDVEYTVTELKNERAQKILSALKTRRRKVFQSNQEDRSKLWYKLWRGNLAKRTKKSMEIRERLNKSGEGAPKYGAWDEKPLSPDNLEEIMKRQTKSTSED